MRPLTKMSKTPNHKAENISPLVDISYFRSRRFSSGADSGDSEPGSPVPLVWDGESVRPCTDEELVRKCVESFDADGKCTREMLTRVIFQAHSWFISPTKLMEFFIDLFDSETNHQEKVLHAVRFWMNNYPQLFDLDMELVGAVKELEDISGTNLLENNNRGSYEWMRTNQMSRRPVQMSRKNHKVSLVFHHLDAEEIAIHMSYLEFKCFKRLTLEDLRKYAKNATIKENPKLERAVILFNNITHWVQCMVLGQKNAQSRADIIVKYINIAKKLHEMRNYNTLVAVVGALTHTAISRLKQTASCLPKEHVKELQEIVHLLDSKKNYCAYRRDYTKGSFGFKIPIIGVLMKDLIGLHAAMPDRNPSGQINIRKMAILSGMFKELSELQKMQYPVEVNRDLVNTMRVSLYLYYSEEEIYSLSLQREPRDPKLNTSGPSSPDASQMVFAEFAKYTCQLDRESVRQHVTAMVESVFKAYDNDGDGCISEAEFEKFNSNFPGMDSFADMDVDKDGRISSEEMLNYFLKASSTRRNEFCQSFKHDFVETTYFHFTYCEECDKLLWGFVKQGWKCKGCGINCHKQCKDRIVQECRVKNIRNELPPNGHGKKENTAKRKEYKKNREHMLSVSSDKDFKNNDNIKLIRRVASSPKFKPK